MMEGGEGNWGLLAVGRSWKGGKGVRTGGVPKWRKSFLKALGTTTDKNKSIYLEFTRAKSFFKSHKNFIH